MISAIWKYLQKNDTDLGTYNVLYVCELKSWSCDIRVHHIFASYCMDRIYSCMQQRAVALLLWNYYYYYYYYYYLGNTIAA